MLSMKNKPVKQNCVCITLYADVLDIDWYSKWYASLFLSNCNYVSLNHVSSCDAYFAANAEAVDRDRTSDITAARVDWSQSARCHHLETVMHKSLQFLPV